MLGNKESATSVKRDLVAVSVPAGCDKSKELARCIRFSFHAKEKSELLYLDPIDLDALNHQRRIDLTRGIEDIDCTYPVNIPKQSIGYHDLCLSPVAERRYSVFCTIFFSRQDEQAGVAISEASLKHFFLKDFYLVNFPQISPVVKM